MFFRLIGVHISFCGGKSILHVCLYTVPNRIFHPKTTSDSPLSSKKEIGRSGHISRFWMYNPSWTYVCIQSSQWLNIQKRPLYPSLTRKKYRDWLGSISCLGRKTHSSHMVHMHFKTEFLTTKQPLIPRLARKNKMAGLNSYLASGCRFILCVFLYTVKNRKQKFDVGKQSLRPLPFLSGEENVLHAFLFLAFLFLRVRKVEEV